MKEHPYPKEYLESNISLHRLLFVKLKEQYPDKSFCSMVNTYLASSGIRAAMDAGNWSALNKGHIQLLNSIDIATCDSKGSEPYITDFIAHWFADIYVLFQWTYNIPSCDIVKKIPAEELLRIFEPLHETSEKIACEKIYNKYFLIHN